MMLTYTQKHTKSERRRNSGPAAQQLGGARLENMALPAIAQALLELADRIEDNSISHVDTRERPEEILESMAAYSTATDTDIDGVAVENIATVLQRLEAVVPERERGRHVKIIGITFNLSKQKSVFESLGPFVKDLADILKNGIVLSGKQILVEVYKTEN
ncbi:uncharacterized protein V6R79_002267 [Siganus canaliculatus]